MTDRATPDLTTPEHTATVRCEEVAVNGAGSGTCGSPLDSHGGCPAAGNHRDYIADAAPRPGAETGEGDTNGVELPSIRVVPPQEVPTQQDMKIGVRVLRFAERAALGQVRAEMPCCPRGEATERPPRPARAILLPTAPDTRITEAVCAACHWLWSFRVINEGGGKYVVVFDLLKMVAVAERTRSYTNPR